jgi:hypothetical protein
MVQLVSAHNILIRRFAMIYMFKSRHLPITSVRFSKPKSHRIHRQEDALVAGLDRPTNRSSLRHVFDRPRRVLRKPKEDASGLTGSGRRTLACKFIAQSVDTSGTDKDGHGHGLSQETGTTREIPHGSQDARAKIPLEKGGSILSQGLLIVGSGREILVESFGKSFSS